MFLYLGFVGHPSNLLHQVVPVPCVTQFRMLTSHAIQYLYLHFCTDFIMLLTAMNKFMPKANNYCP